MGAATRPGSGQFVGREQERDLLDVTLRAARAGTGHLVLISGEPGVGKTRLAEEAAALAWAEGTRCGWGRTSEEEGSPPYWPFRQIMRMLDSSGPVLFGPTAGAARAETAAQARFRLFETVTDAFRSAAEPAGLLLVLDDIQWADPASLQLLAHLARGVSDSRVAVVATYRDTETAGQEPLLATLAALAREPSVTRLRLVGLTEAEVGIQLAQVTGWKVPPSVAAAVCRRTRGNPFFVKEMGSVLASSADGKLPDGVRDAVRGRLARLSPECRALVSTAAALGSEMDPAALAAVRGRDLGVVLAAVDEAVAAGIVGEGPAHRFTHDLIREAARLEVSTAERLALHQAMAGYLTERGDAAGRAAKVAHHWLEALPAGDPVQAVAAVERAVAQAMAQLAWEEAESLCRRALAALATSRLSRADRGRLLLARAGAQVRCYDVEGARQSVLTVAEIARDLGDAHTIAYAALTMEGVTDFRWDATGRALCEEALAGIPEVDSGLRARLLAQLVIADTWRSLHDAKPRAATALAMAERVGDRRAIVEALRAGQIARSGPDGAADRLALGNRLLTIGADGDEDAALWGHLWRFDALAQLGDVGAAEAELTPISAVAQRLRSPLARWHAVRCRATIAAARGRFAEAVDYGEQAEALARRAGHEGSLLPSLGFLLLVRAETGDLDEQPDDLLRLHSHNIATTSMRAVLARWRLALGQRDEAERIYRTLPSPTDLPAFVLLPALAGMAELAAEFDDRSTATEVYRMLSPYADLFICGGAGAILIDGSAHLGLGVAAATIGRLDDAARHLRAAVQINERAGLPPRVAVAKFQLAKVLARRRRPGDRDEASAVATSVVAVAAGLGMAPLAHAATEFAASLAGHTAGPLSRRELQVATLVSQGLTNRQIAAAEHISERTVETHVRNIFTKLGFGSRSQVATWIATGGAQHRLRTPDQ